MENNPSPSDPKSIWQNQPAETSKVTMMLIRQRARDLHTKTRRALIGTAISHLIALAGCVAGAFLGGGRWPGQRMAFGAGIVYTLIAAVIVNRNMWAARMPGDAGFATGIEFCRKELARQVATEKRAILWVAGPLIYTVVGAYLGPVIVTTIRATPDAGPKVLMNILPFIALMTIWAVSAFFIRIRQKRDLQREIDDLDAIAKESR